MTKDTVLERFNKYVVRRDGDRCWSWCGTRFKMGYSYLYRKTGSKYAHRISYELFIGPIPDGLNVLHKCDNPECTNPAHLFLGTQADNSDDKVSKGRQARGADIPWTSLTEADVVHIRQMAAQGIPPAEIGTEYNLQARSVYKIAHGLTWAHIPGALPADRKRGRRRGEKNHRAKLDSSMVARIRELWATGDYTKVALAAMFNISDSTIGQIIRHKIWKRI